LFDGQRPGLDCSRHLIFSRPITPELSLSLTLSSGAWWPCGTLLQYRSSWTTAALPSSTRQDASRNLNILVTWHSCPFERVVMSLGSILSPWNHRVVSLRLFGPQSERRLPLRRLLKRYTQLSEFGCREKISEGSHDKASTAKEDASIKVSVCHSPRSVVLQ